MLADSVNIFSLSGEVVEWKIFKSKKKKSWQGHICTCMENEMVITSDMCIYKLFMLFTFSELAKRRVLNKVTFRNHFNKKLRLKNKKDKDKWFWQFCRCQITHLFNANIAEIRIHRSVLWFSPIAVPHILVPTKLVAAVYLSECNVSPFYYLVFFNLWSV